MSYDKTVWNAGAAPGISAENLNNIELGIERTHARSMTENERDALTGDDLFAGRVIYNTDTDLMNVYTGSAWVEVAEEHGNEKHDPNMATATELTTHENEVADTNNVHGLREDKVIIGAGSAGAGTRATAVGKDASAAGTDSVAIGEGANAGGDNSISIGTQALDAVPEGSIGIGYICDIESTATRSVGLGDGAWVEGSNAMALGSNAYASANNSVRIGDINVNSIGGYADWSNVSDERDKTDIQSSEHGLNIITKLNPIKYRLDPRKRYEEKDDDGKVTKHKKDGSKANEKYSYGFSAQELVKALKDTDLDIVDDADPDQLAVREGKLVPVLVKAVQELAAEVERLKEAK